MTTGFDRAELDDFWQHWLDGNRKAQDTGDWTILAEFYTADATYGWSYSPTDHFMADGRDEIRDLALGTEMLGFQGWIYPYQSAVIDDRSGMVVGFWRQMTSAFTDPTGTPYEVEGLGCSWFQYAGDQQWAWQRDVFDVAMAGSAVVRILQDGTATPELNQRMQTVAAGNLPGHYPSVSALAAPLWPVPRVEH
jgi:hypothetical protein